MNIMSIAKIRLKSIFKASLMNIMNIMSRIHFSPMSVFCAAKRLLDDKEAATNNK